MIFTLTLNPAVDRILFLDEFQRSRTNRLSRSLESIGGKGTHVSVNLMLLGVQSTALGIALGDNGRKIISMLRSSGADVQFLQYDLPGMQSRTNYEIVEDTGHVCTMITERGPTLPRRLTDELLEQVKGLLKRGDMLVLSGDASNIEDTAIYSKLTLAANELGARVCLDASGPYLKAGLQSGPFLIKPNLEELSFVSGRDLQTEADILAAMQALEGCNIPMIALTRSARGAIVKDGRDYYEVQPLNVQAVNEGGCGDAFLAAIIAGIEKKWCIEETLKAAAGTAAAAAECELTVGFDLQRAAQLREQAVVVRLR